MSLEKVVDALLEKSNLSHADLQEAKIQRNIIVATYNIENANYEPLDEYLGCAAGAAVGTACMLGMDLSAFLGIGYILFGGYAGKRIAMHMQFKNTNREYRKFIDFIIEKELTS